MSPDPDVVVAAARGCSTVASLSSGVLGEVATLLPGRRVAGVRIRTDVVELHVVARWGVTVPELEAEVRAAVEPLVGSHALHLHVADVALPSEPAPPSAVDLVAGRQPPVPREAALARPAPE